MSRRPRDASFHFVTPTEQIATVRALRALALFVALSLAAFGGACSRTQAHANANANANAIETAETPSEGAAEAARREIGRELDDFHDAAAHAAEERYFAHFAEDGVFLGTDATERWDLHAFRAYAHPHFSKGSGWTFHVERRMISVVPEQGVAWFDEDLRGDKLGPARGSGVLRLAAGRWLLEQYNLSLTVPNERFGAVRAVLDGPTRVPRP